VSKETYTSLKTEPSFLRPLGLYVVRVCVCCVVIYTHVLEAAWSVYRLCLCIVCVYICFVVI